MTPTAKLLQDRLTYSGAKLKHLRNRLGRNAELRKNPNLCVYATGSFGRGEASPESDLDIFFIDRGSDCTRITMALVTADLVMICRQLQLPEFSDGGRYLELHRLSDITQKLGSPDDDHLNYFTARMLLLLESVPVSHRNAYQQVLEAIIESYFRDYHDHDTAFRPMFLANDIIRFWKTLCLNYEHKRNQQVRDVRAKRKAHLKNLKLKFSRLTTCYSMILPLAQDDKSITPERLLSTVQKRPLQRLREVARGIKGGTELVTRLEEEYAWFLESTGRSEDTVLEWIGNRDRRNEAFARARQYGRDMYSLLVRAAEDRDTLRYLLI